MGSVRARRPTPRRREAPRWSADQWADANVRLLSRCRERCECCGQPLTAVERHHRKRRRDGGDRLANVLMLLPACHAHWTTHPARARELGIIVSVSEDPALVPLMHLGREWRLLDDFGMANPIR